MKHKSVHVLTTSGLNLVAPQQCHGCLNLTEAKLCNVWAFPESKWAEGHSCSSYQTDNVIENDPDDEV